MCANGSAFNQHLWFATYAMRNFLNRLPHLGKDVEKMVVHARAVQIRASRKSLHEITKKYKPWRLDGDETITRKFVEVTAYFLFLWCFKMNFEPYKKAKLIVSGRGGSI